jgi:hypothetical protein
MEAINIDTLDQISHCKNNFESAGSCNLRDACKIRYDIDFYAICNLRMTTIVTYYNKAVSLPAGGKLKEPLYCIARR